MSEGAYKVFQGTYWYVRVPTGACGWLLVSEGAYSCLWVPTGAY